MAQVELVHHIQLFLLHGFQFVLGITVMGVDQLQELTVQQFCFYLTLVEVEVHLQCSPPVYGYKQNQSKMPDYGPGEIPHHYKYIEISHMPD